MITTRIGLLPLAVGWAWLTAAGATERAAQETPTLDLPVPDAYSLRLLSPTTLELRLVDNGLTNFLPVVRWWDLATTNAVLQLPPLTNFVVQVGGQPALVQALGFRRRVLYAPLNHPDLRVDNRLYLGLASPVPTGQTVQVLNPNTVFWPTNIVLNATADPLRYSPAIHVNQEGYVPEFPKKAMVGFYLGTLGELDLTNVTTFTLVDAQSGAVVYQGSLLPRLDVGFSDQPLPYQQVLEADFSAFTTPGLYRLAVPGLGVSWPFRIDEGIAMDFVRAYALGLYHQRCGTNNLLPYTRFTHDPCHIAPALVPLPPEVFAFTWNTIAHYGTTLNPDNPPQTAPLLTNAAAELYPFVRHGAVDVSGGHHDAGDYSKYTINSTALIHYLMFAVDAFPGVAALDNLGLPESGDGISDLLEEAKWEADFLAKLQDTDGGFYFLVYPRNREYEYNVLPDHGDPQVVWPKNTAVTAAAVAALTECASSPRFRRRYPAAAAQYLQQGLRGWNFLTNAIARYGKAGAYQKLTAYGDDFTHDDELAWAACELYLATANPLFQQKLFEWFPDPGNKATWRWGWIHMYASYGNAVRSYAFAARSGRLAADQLDTNYLAKCEAEIQTAAQDVLRWSQASAYGTSFSDRDKHGHTAGWYFSNDKAFDLSVAYQLTPRADYLEAIVANLNYEAGCNPVNVCYLEGLGWKRQREVVSQYAQNDRRVLPPSGLPVGNLQSGFVWFSTYGGEPGALSLPPDDGVPGPYPLYDRWADAYNVTTEVVSEIAARCLASLSFLATLTAASTQAWTSPAAWIAGLPPQCSTNSPVTASLQVPGMDLSTARVVWEANDQQPAYGPTYTFSPPNYGPQWVEAEAQWPDGRRAFAATNFFATNGLPSVTVVAASPHALLDGPILGLFEFIRTGATEGNLTVQFNFSGSATKFVDYRTLEGNVPVTLTLPAGSDHALLPIVPMTNRFGLDEPTVVLTLLTNPAYNVGVPATATVALVSGDPRIIGVVRNPTGGVALTWTSQPGKGYVVAYQPRLTTPDWQPISGTITATDWSTRWIDTNAVPAESRYYRVLSTPLPALMRPPPSRRASEPRAAVR